MDVLVLGSARDETPDIAGIRECGGSMPARSRNVDIDTQCLIGAAGATIMRAAPLCRRHRATKTGDME
jgi:hypothetical protein